MLLNHVVTNTRAAAVYTAVYEWAFTVKHTVYTSARSPHRLAGDTAEDADKTVPRPGISVTCSPHKGALHTSGRGSVPQSRNAEDSVPMPSYPGDSR